MTDLIYAAAAGIYWDLGWRGIIPVDPADKGGVPKGFTGHDGIDVTRENLDWFIKSKPSYNIGLRQPDDAIGIDVDNWGGKNGGATIAEAEKRYGKLPYSPRSTSRDDGISGIRVYRIPPGVELVGEIGFPKLGLGGVEFIQRHHRHVQCWPSRHPETGRLYQWLGIDDQPLAHPPHYPGDIPDLPAAWLEAFRKPERNGADLGDQPADPTIVDEAITDGEMSQRVAFKLGQALTELHSGQCRHDATRGRVLGLLRLGKQGEPGVKTALTLLRKAFGDVADATGRSGGRDRADYEFTEFIYKKVGGRWVASDDVARLLAATDYDDDWVRNLGEPPDTDDHAGGEYIPGEDAEPSTDKTPVLADILLTRSALLELPDPEPLIDDVLDQGTVALLYGMWGVGKSFIGFDWGASVATARPWQDRHTEQRRVLYMAAEGAYGLKGRTHAWEQGWHTKINDGTLDILPRPVNLTNTAEVRDLRALIDWGGYSFIILDTLARCMVGADENSARDCGGVVDVLHRLRQSTPGGRGVVLGVHHTGKDAKTFRGSSAFEAGADTVYSVTLDGAVIILDREKRKDGPKVDTHRLKLGPVEGAESLIIEVSRGETNSGRGDKLLSHFRSHFAARGAYATQLLESSEMKKPTFYRALSDLLERGEIINEGTEKRPFYKVATK